MKREFIRDSIKDLEAYSPVEQKANALLNANENPYNLPEDIRKEISEKILDLEFNRYPDPLATKVRKSYSEMINIPIEKIMVGNGSDDILSILTNTFINPGDTVVSHNPSFSMYEIWTNIAGGKFLQVNDNPDHTINIEGIIEEAKRNNAKLVYICSPNNPTGYKISRAQLRDILESVPSLVVLDEAYVEFDDQSLTDLVNTYDNLIVLRTMSKAFRFPAGRCGFAIAPVALIEDMKKVKAPYNVNSLTQEAAKIVIDHREELEPVIESIKKERDKIYNILSKFNDITVYPSHANFLYLTTSKDKELQKAFLEKDILVRYFPNDHAFRITIGTPEENKLVTETIEEVFN